MNKDGVTRRVLDVMCVGGGGGYQPKITLKSARSIFDISFIVTFCLLECLFSIV